MYTTSIIILDVPNNIHKLKDQISIINNIT